MKGKNGKPIKVKPGMYAIFFTQMKAIAEDYGYNLLINGSLDRDMDIVAVPWIDKPGDEQEMIKDFQRYLKGIVTITTDGTIHYTILPANRHSYIIDLNRGDRHGEWNRFEDEEFYLDISVIQPSKTH
jgi:hypothetical protein